MNKLVYLLLDVLCLYHMDPIYVESYNYLLFIKNRTKNLIFVPVLFDVSS